MTTWFENKNKKKSEVVANSLPTGHQQKGLYN